MHDTHPNTDLLFALRDVGVQAPLAGDAGDRRARAALRQEIARPTRRRARWLARGLRPAVLVPAALLLTTAAAAAAGVATGVLNPFAFAEHNATDAPARQFQVSPGRYGPTVNGKPIRETVIPATIRKAEALTVRGVGSVQFWVADSQQHGVCAGVRLPSDQWAGLQNGGRVGGAMPGCVPTRAQIGADALIIDGFDYTESDVVARSGKHWMLLYGAVTAPGNPATVRDRFSGRSTRVIDGRYFAIALQPFHNDDGDYVHLQAFNAAGELVASAGRALPGTMTARCIGGLRTVKVRVPAQHQPVSERQCRGHWIRVTAGPLN
jgi:hypothetical protein